MTGSWSLFIFTCVIVIPVICLIIASLTGRHTIFEPLSRTEGARGLITFLFALITVSIAFILAIYGLYGDGQNLDLAKRFDLVKEVLTLMIGILGTIVGFYFGLSPGIPTQTLQISPAYLSNQNPQKGESTTIVSFVTGGKPPYTYSITFDTTDISTLSDVVTQNGSIQQQVNIPADATILPTGTAVGFQINVRDS